MKLVNATLGKSSEMFEMQNARSNGVFTTLANSLFEMTKSFFTNESAWTSLLKYDLRDLNTDTSKG